MQVLRLSEPLNAHHANATASCSVCYQDDVQSSQESDLAALGAGAIAIGRSVAIGGSRIGGRRVRRRCGRRWRSQRLHRRRNSRWCWPCTSGLRWPDRSRGSELGVDAACKMPLHIFDNYIMDALGVSVDVREGADHDVDG